jgi:alanyl-tRNA synthetase
MPTAEEIAAQKAEEAKKQAEEADKALEERISKTVNAALTSHMKRAPKALSAEELEKFLEEREAKRTAAEEEKKKGGAGGGKGNESQPEVARLQKELEQLRKRSEEAEKKAADKERKEQERSDSDTISKTLESAGVPAGQRVRVALNHLKSEGRVKRTDEGELVFVDEQGDEIELAKGITAFLKTDEGKLFLPATGAGGSGGGRFERKPAGGGGKAETSKARAGRLLGRIIAGGGGET